MTAYRHELGEHVFNQGAARRRRTANVVSLVGMCLCVGAGVSLAAGGGFVLAGLLFSVGGACDVLDGVLARGGTEVTHPIGAFIDSMCDKVGEAAVLAGLLVAVQDRQNLRLLVAAYMFGALSSYVKATAGEHGLRISWPEVRYFGRAGRAVILAFTLVLADAVTMIGGMSWLTLGFSVLLAFNIATFVWRLGRIVWAAHQLSRPLPSRGVQAAHHLADELGQTSAQVPDNRGQPTPRHVAGVR